MLFWKDENGGQHADISKILDKPLKPGQTYTEESSPVYLICASGSDYKNALKDFEFEINNMPTWQVFRR